MPSSSATGLYVTRTFGIGVSYIAHNRRLKVHTTFQQPTSHLQTSCSTCMPPVQGQCVLNIYIQIYTFIYLSIYLSIYRQIDIFIYLSIYLYNPRKRQLPERKGSGWFGIFYVFLTGKKNHACIVSVEGTVIAGHRTSGKVLLSMHSE